jgi:HK97 family phage major capsid protein
MKNSKELSKEIQALQARVQAIVAVAKEENRDLLDDESAEVDAIVGTDDKPGKIVALQSELKRAEKIEATVSTRVKKIEDAEIEAKSFKVPARAKATGALRAFESEQDAYDMGQFIRATIYGNGRAKQHCRDRGIKASMLQNDNTTGGFLVPEPLENAIIKLRQQYGVFRQQARAYPMSDGVVNVPRVAGEVTTYFVGESATITESDMTLSQIKLEAKKLAAQVKFSSELGEEAIVSIADLIAESMGQALAIKEDECGFLGDATSAYGGIRGLASALAAGSLVTATGRTTFSALTIADFESMIGLAKMWPGMNPKWYVSNAGWAASMQRLANAVGGTTATELQNGVVRNTFLGYEVVKTQVLTSALTGTSGLRALYFGDLNMGCWFGTRRGLRIRADESKYFSEDMVAIQGTQRFDINIYDVGTASDSGGIIGLVFG